MFNIDQIFFALFIGGALGGLLGFFLGLLFGTYAKKQSSVKGTQSDE